MFTDPRELIVETIDKLETVAAFFADEVDERERARRPRRRRRRRPFRVCRSFRR